MAAIKITNPKIGAELVEELQDEPAYQSRKAFSAIFTPGPGRIFFRLKQ